MAGKFRPLLVLLFFILVFQVEAQESLTLQQALDLGVKNYGTIKSREFLSKAAEHAVSQSRRDYLPNVVLSAQQVYGTVNGQNGPAYGFGGFGVASSGLPLKEQNWNAAFGALYLANVNWEIFTFGRTKGRIEASKAFAGMADADLEQEQFQHQVRVAAAYLNALASERLAVAQQKNLVRAQVVQRSVAARAKGGLVAGVDSALANAEVANARIAFLRAIDIQQEEHKKLALLIGRTDFEFNLDSGFVSKLPTRLVTDTSASLRHPILRYYQSRLDQTLAQLKLGKKSYFPSLNLVGVFQTRASGFRPEYTQDQTAYSQSYSVGIKPTRSNYLVGVALTWNLTSILRADAQVRSLNYQNLAAESDLQLAHEQLNTQLQIADNKLTNALLIQHEAPVQVQSATDAYTQKSALYRNGLTTMVEVTQTLYTLNRAETDRDIAYINVWQALLMKAAANGDIHTFTNELSR